MSKFVPDMFHLHGQMKREKRGQGVKGLESKTAIFTITSITTNTITVTTTVLILPTANTTPSTVMP